MKANCSFKFQLSRVRERENDEKIFQKLNKYQTMNMQTCMNITHDRDIWNWVIIFENACLYLFQMQHCSNIFFLLSFQSTWYFPSKLVASGAALSLSLSIYRVVRISWMWMLLVYGVQVYTEHWTYILEHPAQLWHFQNSRLPSLNGALHGSPSYVLHNLIFYFSIDIIIWIPNLENIQ